MSVYHNSFTYLGVNSLKDKNWIVTHFDPDNGETDSYLEKDQIYSDSYDGTKRILYGTKYSSVANPVITVIKQDGTLFSLEEIRAAYKWLTGNKSSSWLDLYVDDEVTYRLLTTIQNVKPYKQDARTIGLNIYCESLSPWGYSPVQTISQSIIGEETITINNLSDDLYSYTPVNIKFENTSGDALQIVNNTLNETTKINNVKLNEIITLNDNMTITSDDTTRIFGNDFNFVFPRLKSGLNELTITGTGIITIEYIYCIKMGDMAININSLSAPICDDEGNITVDALDWSRIINTPHTLSGYGIDDAYTKTEVDSKFSNITTLSVPWDSITHKPELYTKSEIDTILENFVSDEVYTKEETNNMFYTKVEVDALLDSIKIEIDETELNTMLMEVLV